MKIPKIMVPSLFFLQRGGVHLLPPFSLTERETMRLVVNNEDTVIIIKAII
jgi:hypothetical protein